MLKIGLTGGIGSGKTHITKAFSILGIPMYNADEKAKQILNNNKSLQKKINHFFDKDIFDNRGKLQKKKLSDIIFNDKKKLNWLNNLVHPLVWQDYEHWLALQNNVPYVLKESAILVETELYKEFDAIILVTSPKKMRISRLLQTGKYTQKNIQYIMKNQLLDKIRKKYCDYTILNDEKSLVIPQVLSLHKKILSKS